MPQFEAIDVERLCPSCKQRLSHLSLARRVKARRAALRLSAAAVARQVGVTPSTIYAFEDLFHKPHEAVLAKFLAWLDLPDDQARLSLSTKGRKERQP